VDRTTHCFLSWQVATDRDQATIQSLVDAAPRATQYYSDAWSGYANVVYFPGQHLSLPNKTQTYSVEAGNAELRHYLARLARASRCFSRSLDALRAALKLFVFAWNRRQLAKHQHPQYRFAVADFLYP
jgi:IS1 family transposase